MNRRAARILAQTLSGPLLVALALGGCAVTGGAPNGSRDDARGAAEALLADGLELDLAAPPTRSDLGLPDGETSAVLERADRAPFDVAITFSDGHVLTTPATTLIVTSDDPAGPPTALSARRDELDLDTLEAVLDDAVATLGADPARADALLADARRGNPAGGNVTRVLPTGVTGLDQLTIQAIVPPEQGRVIVHFDVAWR